MTKEKWIKILEDEVRECSAIWDPLTWDKDRMKILNIIKEMDRATEVYNLENNKKVEE